MESVIECRNLTHCYGRRKIYENLSFDVPEGRILGLLGKNGTGKTTTINILSGYLEPRSGECRIFGENIRRMRPLTRRRIGLLIEGHVQYQFMSIEQIERFYAAFYPKWRREAYYELMRKLHVGPGQRISRMSCGQRSQVALGLILAQDPDLLVLDDMSFNIRKGEFVCVVGPTGCGKTTFLNCLTRIHMPSEGDLYIDGVPADPRKHNISFVFQEPSALPWLTVEDNLAYGLKIKRIPKAEIDRRVNQILDLMGLQEFRKAYPGELSVSAEQRIIIGRSFAMQPDLLLMDEPYGQMDVKMRFYLEDAVIGLWKELGRTGVFITHNIEEAVYLAERVLILSNKPAKIKEEVRIDLPRPRDITSSQFIQYRNYITDKIKWW